MPSQLHEVRSIIQTVDLADQIYFQTTDVQETVVNAVGDCPSGEENLIHKAITRLRAIRSFGGVTATVHKNIPSGSGLGGASSNAAAALKAVNKLFELNVSEDELLDISRQLGSDVPALFLGGCTYVEGTGDIVRNIESPLEHEYIVLVKPEFSTSTREAYKGLDEYANRLENDLYPADFNIAGCFNDFEPWALQTHELLSEIKQLAVQFNPLATCLSGSGSTYFAIFNNVWEANGFKESVSKLGQVKSVFVVKAIDRGMDI